MDHLRDFLSSLEPERMVARYIPRTGTIKKTAAEWLNDLADVELWTFAWPWKDRGGHWETSNSIWTPLAAEGEAT